MTTVLPPSPLECLSFSRDATIAGDRTHFAGILPFCLDKPGGNCYFLFGVSHAKQLCHFHGWVDKGETIKMGASREGYEESRGVFGTPSTLWQCLHSIGTFSEQYLYEGMYAVFLGYLDASQRRQLCIKFHPMPMFYGCMNETFEVVFAEGRELQTKSTEYMDPQGGALIQVEGICLQTSQYQLKQYPLRSFVQGWLKPVNFWTVPWIRDAMDHGTTHLNPCLPLVENAGPNLEDMYQHYGRNIPMTFMMFMGRYTGQLVPVRQGHNEALINHDGQLVPVIKSQRTIFIQNGMPVKGMDLTSRKVKVSFRYMYCDKLIAFDVMILKE